MIMSKDTFLERLYVLFRDDKVRDAASILESLRDEMYTQEAEHIANIQRMAEMNPPTYGVAKMGAWQDVDEGGHIIERRTQVERYKVREKDVPAFCKAMGVKEKELWPVLRGERLEVDGWRSFEGRSLNSKVFIDKRAYGQTRDEIVAGLQKEQEAFIAHVDLRNEILRQNSQKRYDQPVVDWTPDSK